MTTYGYARVSTRKAKGRKEQHADNQVQRLTREAGIDRKHIYVDDGVSGRKASRPAWDELWSKVGPGDKIVATRMSRVGRSLENLIAIVAECDRRGIDIKFLDEECDTSTANGRLLFRIMAAVQAYSAELTQENVIEGLERARERHGGKLPTRGASFTEKQRREALELLKTTNLSSARIAKSVGVSRPTLYRHMGEEIKARKELAAK